MCIISAFKSVHATNNATNVRPTGRSCQVSKYEKFVQRAEKLLTVETVTKALIVQFQFIWRYNFVLSFAQNSWKDSAVSRRATGILFQLSGPKMANERGPSVFVRDAGTTKSPCAAERR